ncbi:hypothetical protein [Bacillus cereus]|uniref:hypothetical protein n=1 Tax=Bacillus cereus TaxID=1396 RepID=UPI000BF2DDB5|nr:hypothetical protein [Bacillus cereus]PFS47139.1 hypothetical protein COK44_17375 [Bacillus cereus]
MKVNLNGVLELGPDERYEGFQEKLINWISSNGWKAEKVGGIKIPVKLHMKMQAGSGAAIFDTNNKKYSNKRYFLSRTWDTN